MGRDKKLVSELFTLPNKCLPLTLSCAEYGGVCRGRGKGEASSCTSTPTVGAGAKG